MPPKQPIYESPQERQPIRSDRIDAMLEWFEENRDDVDLAVSHVKYRVIGMPLPPSERPPGTP